jgi:hypothetical protein
MPKTYPTDYDWWISTSSRTFRKLGTQLTAFNNSFSNHKNLSACTPTEITALDGLYGVWVQSKGGTATRITTTREPQATELRKKLVAACNAKGVASACTMVAGPVRVAEVVAPVVVVPVPRVRRAGGTPMDWVNEVSVALNRFNPANYAVNDAAAFPGDIKKGQESVVLAKLVAVNKTNPSLAWTMAEAMMPRGTEWNEGAISPAYRRLHGAGADAKIGVCTSFAKAAAHILTKDRESGPLVELVSFTGRAGVAHVYVVVGRNGGYEGTGRKLPPPTEWGAQTVLVDAWLGAMGHGVIFTVANFPSNAQGYLRNATAVMIRDAS